MEVRKISNVIEKVIYCLWAVITIVVIIFQNLLIARAKFFCYAPDKAAV
jgi:cell division protein FtsL